MKDTIKKTAGKFAVADMVKVMVAAYIAIAVAAIWKTAIAIKCALS